MGSETGSWLQTELVRWSGQERAFDYVLRAAKAEERSID